MEEEKKGKTVPDGYYSHKPSLAKRGSSKFIREIRKGMTVFVVVAACIAFYFALLRLPNISGFFLKALDVLKPILYGLLIAYLLHPIVMAIEAYLKPFLAIRIQKEETINKVARSVGIICAITLLIIGIVALINLLIPELYTSIVRLVFTLPTQVNHLLDQISSMKTAEGNTGVLMRTIVEQGTDAVEEWLETNVLGQASNLMSYFTTGVIDVISELFDVIIGVIVSVYLLFSKETFIRQSKKLTYAVFTPRQANFLLHIAQKANEIFGGFMVGKILDSMIIGVICFFGLSILNMPYTLLISVVVGVTNVIPFFGPYIGAIPSAILILLVSPMKCLYFLIFILILQQVDGNIIGPKILGSSTGLSSFWVIFAILVGGGLFGFPGMIFGVPTFAVIYYVIQLLVNDKLHSKNLPHESEYYDEFSFVDESGKYVLSEQVREKKRKEHEERVRAEREQEKNK